MLYKHKNIAYNEPYNLLNNFTRTAKKNWRIKKYIADDGGNSGKENSNLRETIAHSVG